MVWHGVAWRGVVSRGVGMAQHGMAWRGVAWRGYGIAWRGVVWCHVGWVWHSMAWRGVVSRGVGMAQHGMAWRGVAWRGYGTAWHGVAWRGVAWRGYGTAWRGVAWAGPGVPVAGSACGTAGPAPTRGATGASCSTAVPGPGDASPGPCPAPTSSGQEGPHSPAPLCRGRDAAGEQTQDGSGAAAGTRGQWGRTWGTAGPGPSPISPAPGASPETPWEAGPSPSPAGGSGARGRGADPVAGGPVVGRAGRRAGPRGWVPIPRLRSQARQSRSPTLAAGDRPAAAGSAREPAAGFRQRPASRGQRLQPQNQLRSSGLPRRFFSLQGTSCARQRAAVAAVGVFWLAGAVAALPIVATFPKAPGSRLALEPGHIRGGEAAGRVGVCCPDPSPDQAACQPAPDHPGPRRGRLPPTTPREPLLAPLPPRLWR